MQDLLTRMERPGTILDLTAEMFLSNKSLWHHLLALRGQGHAIQMDETFDSGHRSLGMRFYHYRTCKICCKEKPWASMTH